MAQYISTVLLKDEGPFPTFKEAFHNFFRRVEAECQEVRQDLLNEGCYIERKGGPGPMFMRQLVEVGHKLGLTDDEGNLVPEAPEPHADLLETFFSAAADRLGDALDDLLLKFER